MMRRARIMMLVACIFLTLSGMAYVAGSPSVAHANSPSAGGLFTSEGRCAEITQTSGALMGLVVPCIARSIEMATERLATGFANMMMPIFMAFLVLVVSFFGVKVLQGEAQVGKEAFLLLLKIGFVIVFVNNFAGLTPYVYDVIEEGQEIVASAIAPKTLYTFNASGAVVTVQQNVIHCDAAQYRPAGAGGAVWAHMDCLLGEIFGFAFGTGDRHNMVLGASILGLVSGFLFGGTFGIAIFFMAIGFLWSIFSFVLKVGFAFLNGYIIAAIYIIISPLFIPLALLKVTGQYFDKWWRGLAAAMLMPVIVTGYAIFAMLVYDKMLLAPDSLVNNLFSHEIFESANQLEECVDPLGGLINNESAAMRNRGIGMQVFEAISATGTAEQLVGGGNSETCMESIEWNEYSPPDMSKEEFFTEIFLEMAKLLILAVIMQGGLKSVMTMIGMITGKASVGSALQPQPGLEQNLAGGMAAFKRGVNAEMARPYNAEADSDLHSASDVGGGGATGTLFLERLGPALGKGVTGFTGAITRS